MQMLTEAVDGIAGSLMSLLLPPTVLVLLLKVFLPVVGNPLWRAYRRLLVWLFVVPFRLVRWLWQQATRRD